jgi:hypothetical protein
MALEKFKWLKFRVTETEYQDVKIAFAKSRGRWFWQWCRKSFMKSVREQEPPK